MTEVKCYNSTGRKRHFLHLNARYLLGACVLLLAAGCASNPATPLQRAAGQVDESSGYKPRTADLQKVKALVDGGANLNELNNWGTVLHSAAIYGTTDIVEYLVAHGADVNVKDQLQQTPLMLAAQYGKFDIVKLLVQKGADVNTAASAVGGPPLAEAAYSGRYDIVNYLIGKGADVSRQAGIAYVRGAAGMAIRMNESVRQRTAGVESNKENVNYEYIAILEVLKSKGANINAVDQYGRNALHQMATFGNPQVTRYFLKAGVNPNAQDKSLNTPLATARKQRESYVNMLDFHPPGLNAEQVAGFKKYLQETIPSLDGVIAILAPITKVQSAPVAQPVTRPVTVSTSVSISKAVPASSMPERSLTDQAIDTLADCAKLKVSLNICERLPWPASTGCSALSKAQFSNGVCKG